MFSCTEYSGMRPTLNLGWECETSLVVRNNKEIRERERERELRGYVKVSSLLFLSWNILDGTMGSQAVHELSLGSTGALPLTTRPYYLTSFTYFGKRARARGELELGLLLST